MYPVLDMTKFDAYDSYTINIKKKKKTTPICMNT